MIEGTKRSLASLIEERDKTGFATSVIYWGDNLNVLKNLPQNSVDLIYIDPPFSTDSKYWFIWGEKEKEEDEAVIKAYEEATRGGPDTYVDWMGKRVELLHRVLKETGSFYFHCDEQLGSNFQIMLNKVFRGNCQREIIWKIGWVSGFKSRAKNWIRNHEKIFFYTKSKDYEFNKQYFPHPDGYKRRGGGGNPEGVPVDDVWTDIPSIQHLSFSKEKTGYATQKPVALLERIIKSSSNEGDVVLDSFCGCGTTSVAAYNLKRKWIGIDLAEKGCITMKERLENLNASYCIVPWDLNRRQLRELENLSGNEFRDWVVLRIQGIPKRGTDGGVDLYTNRREPVQVKKIRGGVGPGVLRDFRTALNRERKNKGYIISLCGFSRGAIEEASRARNEGVEIELVRVEDIPKYFD